MPQPTQGYHFPPEPQPAYGYSNPQLLSSQQWPQHGEPQAYEINYQAYGGDDQGPFQQQDDDTTEFADEYYDDEEPRRGPRWLLIAVALVGAIGVGGALAYTYRSLVAPSSRVPIVKADPNVKVRPEEPGGRQFPGVEARAPVRIVDEASTAASNEQPPVQDVGPRRIKTIPIAPPGGGSESAEASAAPAAIPGITLYQPPSVSNRAPPAASEPADPPAPEPPKVEAPAEESAGPRRVAIGTPPPAAEEPDEPERAAPPPVKRRPVRTAAVERDPPPPPPPRADPPSSGLGYVAVLFSKKSSIDALKTFADLQQKYSNVLGDKTPDIQKADLSARGLGWMYRLVVGPPGSRQAARDVCAELKSAGYVGCWIKEY